MAETVVLARPEQLSETGQAALRGLLRAWFDFERRLSRLPIHVFPTCGLGAT